MQHKTTSPQDLVLIGGGHAHALVLRKWGLHPLPGVRLTVINPGKTAPYTGMLPGHIAGHYSQDELEIDLERLCQFAGARLIDGGATALDPVAQSVHVLGHGEIDYDVASLDIGITSELRDLPGFQDHGIGAKPLHRYAQVWRQFLAQTQGSKDPAPVAVIGGGVAGVELALAMAHALRDAPHAPVTLIEAAHELTGTSARSRNVLLKALRRAKVTVRPNSQITEIRSQSVSFNDGSSLAAHLVVSAAGARPHPWLANTGLALHNGYVIVDPTLQVRSHPSLFAVGDCAHMDHAPRPKAGVFAVRSAPVLFDNLRAKLTGKTLRPFQPQKSYLKLISLGQKSALAEKYSWPVSGRLLWHWKDWIDRRFMVKFQNYPPGPRSVVPQGSEPRPPKTDQANADRSEAE
ncbi:MAG: FAD-dependent oxidoreductase [Thalassovita sp.]